MHRVSRSLAFSTLLLTVVAGASVANAASPSAGIVPNLGQADPTVRFYTQEGSTTLYFTDDAIVLDQTELNHAVWIRLQGISSQAHFEPVGERVTRLNFFLGADQDKWTTNVPVYDGVVYRNIAPAVDLAFEIHDGALTFELRGDGAEAMDALDLVRAIEPASSAVTLEAPPSHREAGVLRWRPPTGDVPDVRDGADNPATLSYSTLIGGGINDRAHALTFDSTGNPILAGYTQSGNFPSTSGSYDPTHNGGYDCHICKFSIDGTTLLWATFVGGSLEDRVFAIHPASAGNLIFSGHTYSANFPTTVLAYDRTLGGIRDAYVGKLSANGDALLWCTYLGGAEEDRSWDMAIDDLDRPILAGDTGSVDFPVTPGAFDETFSGTLDEGFVTKVAANGRSLVWSTLLGGTSVDYVKFMSLGPDQQPVLTGATSSANFPTTPGAFDETYNNAQDCFVAKLDADGDSLIFGTFLGGTSTDLGEVIVTHPSGDYVLTGSTTSVNFPATSGAYDTSHNGVKDAFITRLTASGDSLVYSTYFGGSGDDEPWALTLDLDGGPIFSGYVESVDFPTSIDAFDLTHNGLQDANITQLDPLGASIRYSTYFGGSDLDGGWELALDGTGNPILTGPTGSPNFPTTPGVYDTSHNGGRDVFLARFDIAAPSSVPEDLGTPNALSCGPNPFSDQTDLRLQLTESGPVRVLVLDATGRRLATLLDASLEPGAHSFTWDGRDARGRRLPAGAYWIRAERPSVRAAATRAESTLGQRRVILVH